MKLGTVSRSGDYVIFTENGQWDYEIPVRDLNNPYWIAEWFRHMTEKSWVTKYQLIEFASIIQSINGGK